MTHVLSGLVRSPPSVAKVSIIGAIGGATASGLLGCAILTLVWTAKSPDGWRRALHWGMLHAALIAVPGMVTGVFSALLSTMLGTTRSKWISIGAGALIGLVMGGGLAWLVSSEASGGVVGVSAIAAQILTGGAISWVARPRVT